MTYPTIKVSSVSGSAAPNASGAGPSTALTGTSNATSNGATPSVITLGGSPDLSGVATNGTHAIYLDTAAGRRFSKITGVDNTAKTVTVEDTITAANCTNRSWAIGGMLSSLWGTGYARLVDDGSSSGDAKAGWTIEFQSGHTETQSTTDIRVGGNTTDGPLVICGAAGAATRPLITTTYTFGVIVRAQCVLRDFDIRTTVSGNTYVLRDFIGACEFRRLRVYSTGATKATRGIDLLAGSRVYSCEVYDCLHGVYTMDNDIQVINSCIRDCATAGIYVSSTVPGEVIGNLIVDCGVGLDVPTGASRFPYVAHNVFDTCTTGYRNASAVPTNRSGMCASNIFANCTTGLLLSNAAMTEKYFTFHFFASFKSNAFWNNTTHFTLNATSTAVTVMEGGFTPSAEPFTTATKAARKTAGDWSQTTETKAVGFPAEVVGLQAVTRSHLDVGLQRQEPSGSGSGGAILMGGMGQLGVAVH